MSTDDAIVIAFCIFAIVFIWFTFRPPKSWIGKVAERAENALRGSGPKWSDEPIDDVSAATQKSVGALNTLGLTDAQVTDALQRAGDSPKFDVKRLRLKAGDILLLDFTKRQPVNEEMQRTSDAVVEQLKTAGINGVYVGFFAGFEFVHIVNSTKNLKPKLKRDKSGKFIKAKK